MLETLNAQYDDIISWADMYDTASLEAKKMIVNCLIKRIVVSCISTSTLTLNNLVLAWTLFLSPHKAKTRFFSETSFRCTLLNDGGE